MAYVKKYDTRKRYIIEPKTIGFGGRIMRDQYSTDTEALLGALARSKAEGCPYVVLDRLQRHRKTFFTVSPDGSYVIGEWNGRKRPRYLEA